MEGRGLRDTEPNEGIDVGITESREHLNATSSDSKTPAYQNAKQSSDPQNACIEHDKALSRVMNAVLKDDTELFKQFVDSQSFRYWLSETVFRITYDRPAGAP